MDEKGRVTLPSAFRREAAGDRFVLLQWEESHLTLFPESVWADKQQELLEFRRTGPEAATYVRGLLSMAVEVTPDKQGRILVPGWLQDAAALESTVLFNGNIDRVELWNPARRRDSESAAVPESVAGSAHRILG